VNNAVDRETHVGGTAAIRELLEVLPSDMPGMVITRIYRLRSANLLRRAACECDAACQVLPLSAIAKAKISHLD